MKKTLFILCALLLTAVGASAQAITSGTYMLQNVETGYYLGSGCTWGTQASLIKQPQQFTLTESSGAYTLESYVYNGANSNKLGTNLYVDGADAASWTIEKQSNGAYTLHNATVGYLAGNGKDAPVEGVTSITSATYWNLITKDDIVASQANATSASPVDVTGLINNPSLNKNSQTTYGTAYWSTTGTVNIGYTNAGGDTKSYGNVAEGYHVGFSMYQTLSNLTPGIYVLSAQGFHRDDDSQASYTAPVMYVGSTLTSDIPSMYSANGACAQMGSSGQTMATAQTDFLSNLYPITPIQFTVDDTNTSVEFGFKGTDEHEWVIWGDLELMYYGTELDYTIGEPECALDGKYVQPGSEVSITFNCTTPNSDEPQLASGKYITLDGTNVTDAALTYSGTTATVTFILPSTIEYGTTVTVSVPEGLLTWSGQDVSSPASATTFTLYTPIMADQMGVYIESMYFEGMLLSRGDDYGTRAKVDRYGVPVDIVFGDDGKATVRYVDSDNYLYGESWAYSDNKAISADPGYYTLVPVTLEGETNVYQFQGGNNLPAEADWPMYVYDEAQVSSGGDNTYHLANNGIYNDNYKDVKQTYWKILTREERDAVKDAWVLGEYQEIAASFGATISSKDDFETFLAALGDGTDATESVTNAELTSITTNEDGVGGWGIKYPSLDGDHEGFNSDTNCTGMINNDGDLYQNVEGLAPGLYKVTLNGFIRHGWYDTCFDYVEYDLSYAKLRANDYEINLVPWAWEATKGTASDLSDSTPNGMANAGEAFDKGKYLNTLYTVVDEDGTLSIEIDCTGWVSSEWVAVKNLTLTYYGNQDVITWTMTDAGYGTIILPFDAEIPTTDDGGSDITWTAYSTGTVTADEDDSGNYTLSLTAETADSEGKITLKANTPYIMAGTEGTYTFTGTAESYTSLTAGYLTGTYETMDYTALMAVATNSSGTVYLLQNHDGTGEDGVAFYPVVEELSSEATLTPYHCYLTLTSSDLQATSVTPAKLSFSFGGEATAIEAVEGAEAEADGAIYDLSGRKVSKAVKGVYIQNGKKVLVK